MLNIRSLELGDATRKLMVQTLTRNNIRVCVYDKLGEDSRFRTLAREDGRYKDLTQHIVDKAQREQRQFLAHDGTEGLGERLGGYFRRAVLGMGH